ncbi:hypothetical protein ACFSJ3_04875 [Corallincola platygyrae]|uniref:Uncharacterized protein n=1 Tax=Corallincola platygyrae TaxID=1193278 RepID=A0ABW4XID7_9GAMM
MDPVLKKLQEKNEAHKKLVWKERKSELLAMPFAIIIFLIYFGTQYYLLGYKGEILGESWEAMAKQVWFLAMVFTTGLGSLFFSGSLAFVIGTSIAVKELGRRINFVKSGLVSTTLLSISLLFFMIGKWVHAKILLNSINISDFFKFGLEETPFIVIYIFLLINSAVAIIFFVLFAIIFTFPFKAKKLAQEAREQS